MVQDSDQVRFRDILHGNTAMARVMNDYWQAPIKPTASPNSNFAGLVYQYRTIALPPSSALVGLESTPVNVSIIWEDD